MTNNQAGRALNQYRDVGTKASVEAASPHRLIGLLLSGAIGRISAALGHLQRGHTGAKAKDITAAMSIVGGLRGSLDLERGGEIAANLDALYDYIERRLLVANAHNDAAALEESVNLLRKVHSGWEGIDPDAPADAGSRGARGDSVATG